LGRVPAENVGMVEQVVDVLFADVVVVELTLTEGVKLAEVVIVEKEDEDVKVALLLGIGDPLTVVEEEELLAVLETIDELKDDVDDIVLPKAELELEDTINDIVLLVPEIELELEDAADAVVLLETEFKLDVVRPDDMPMLEELETIDEVLEAVALRDILLLDEVV
jgi:hypothetical protein